MKRKYLWFICGVVLTILIILLVMYMRSPEESPKEVEKMTEEETPVVLDSPDIAEEGVNEPAGLVAKALNQRGCVFFGNNNCPWCTKQKEEFGSDFDKVKYVDCTQNPDLCSGIRGVPSWKCSDGAQVSGYLPLDKLVQKLNLHI